MAGVEDVENYNFYRTDRVVIDTNVLILVHANTYGNPKGWRVKTFSAAINQIHSVKPDAILLDLVLSEFIHGVERAAASDWAHRQQKDNLPQWQILKEFRKTELYSRAIQDIRPAVSQIESLYRFDRVAPLDPSNSSTTIDQMENSKADLNDVRIANYCVANDADLLTDDRDMAAFGGDIRIITSSNRSERFD